MQLSYFNHLKTIIESNRSKNGYNPLLNESLLDVRQKMQAIFQILNSIL